MSKILWEDAVNSTVADSQLPVVVGDEANVTANVRLRMKKSNGNIVTADILDKFVGEKLDAESLSELMAAQSPIEKTVDGGRVTLSLDHDLAVPQIVEYGTTTWADIDFTKNLILRYISNDTVISTAAYTADDTSLKFYACIDGETYVIQLLHDTNEWSSTILDTSETYIAIYGATTLAELNALSTDKIVYLKFDEAVYVNSYRSTTEWRFTCIDGDMINEAILKSAGWTEQSHSIPGYYTAGTGLKLADNEFSIDDTVVATVDSLEAKQDKLSVTDAQITDAVAKAHVHDNKSVLDGITADDVKDWNAKQDKLVFDTAPWTGSTNPVTSNGIAAALTGKMDKQTVGSSSVPVYLKNGVAVATTGVATKAELEAQNNVILTYGQTPTQTWDELLALAQQGKLFCNNSSRMFQMNANFQSGSTILTAHGIFSGWFLRFSLNSSFVWSTTAGYETANVTTVKAKQDKLTAGSGIDITSNTISSFLKTNFNMTSLNKITPLYSFAYDGGVCIDVSVTDASYYDSHSFKYMFINRADNHPSNVVLNAERLTSRLHLCVYVVGNMTYIGMYNVDYTRTDIPSYESYANSTKAISVADHTEIDPSAVTKWLWPVSNPFATSTSDTPVTEGPTA